MMKEVKAEWVETIQHIIEDSCPYCGFEINLDKYYIKPGKKTNETIQCINCSRKFKLIIEKQKKIKENEDC